MALLWRLVAAILRMGDALPHCCHGSRLIRNSVEPSPFLSSIMLGKKKKKAYDYTGHSLNAGKCPVLWVNGDGWKKKCVRDFEVLVHDGGRTHSVFPGRRPRIFFFTFWSLTIDTMYNRRGARREAPWMCPIYPSHSNVDRERGATHCSNIPSPPPLPPPYWQPWETEKGTLWPRHVASAAPAFDPFFVRVCHMWLRGDESDQPDFGYGPYKNAATKVKSSH